MQFKSPTSEPIHVNLESGHSAVVGPEWRELPLIMHRQALIEGCLSDNMDPATLQAKIESAIPEKTRHDLLVKAIHGMIEGNKEGDMTTAGLPNRKVLSALVGWSVNKEEMMQALYEAQDDIDADGDNITTQIG